MRYVAVTALWCGLAVGLAAQASALQSVAERFEVASIKPSRGLTAVPASAMLFARSYATPEMLITMAYQLQRFRLAGGPEWIRNDRFDVNATTATPQTEAQQFELLRRLLAERFGLRVHWEKREQPVYALLFARADKRLGTALRRSAFNCKESALRGELAKTPKAPSGLSFCYPSIGPGGEGKTRFVVGGMTMAEVSKALENVLDRTVVDHTSLDGTFEVDMTYTRQSTLLNADANAPLDGGSIFVAVQEQLGLKLEPRTEPVDVLVVDAIEHPTPD
jgi:uncharacterized protein (TIGR03435 family)